MAERTLRSLLEPKSSPSELALQAFQKLAETLTALQSTAKSAENGSVQVDPLILNQLAAFVQQGAKTVSPAKRRRKTPPWAARSDAALESVAEIEPEGQEGTPSEFPLSSMDGAAQSAMSQEVSGAEVFQISTPKAIPPLRHMVQRKFSGGVGRMAPLRKMVSKLPVKTITKAEAKQMAAAHTREIAETQSDDFEGALTD